MASATFCASDSNGCRYVTPARLLVDTLAELQHNLPLQGAFLDASWNNPCILQIEAIPSAQSYVLLQL